MDILSARNHVLDEHLLVHISEGRAAHLLSTDRITLRMLMEARYGKDYREYQDDFVLAQRKIRELNAPEDR